MLQAHEDEVCGLHLDEPNLMIYSASCDGWINVIDAKRAVLLDSLETSSPIIAMQGDRKNMRLFVSLG